MGKLRLKGRVKSSLKENNESVEEEDVVFPGVYKFEQGEVHSKVSVTLGYRKSRDYQSVSMDVMVELPSPLGKEKKALEMATNIADEWLTNSEGAVEAALRGLA